MKRPPAQPVVVPLPPKRELEPKPRPEEKPPPKKRPVSLTVQITPTRGDSEEEDDDE